MKFMYEHLKNSDEIIDYYKNYGLECINEYVVDFDKNDKNAIFNYVASQRTFISKIDSVKKDLIAYTNDQTPEGVLIDKNILNYILEGIMSNIIKEFEKRYRPVNSKD